MLLTLENDRAQIQSAPINALMASTLSGALLLEESVGSPRKALVAARFAQRQLEPGAAWESSIPLSLGREILAYDEIDSAIAEQAVS